MKPQFQQHKGDGDTPGDCVRACIASILDMPIGEVPHFAAGGEGTLLKMIDMFLEQIGMRLWVTPYVVNHDTPVDDVLLSQAVFNPDAYYMVTGLNENGGAHMVVCQNNEIVHDPAGGKTTELRPHEPKGPMVDYHYNLFVITFRGSSHRRSIRLVKT